MDDALYSKVINIAASILTGAAILIAGSGKSGAAAMQAIERPALISIGEDGSAPPKPARPAGDRIPVAA